jgi:hypothetical protein
LTQGKPLFFLGTLFCALFVSLVLARVHYIDEKGFNPTDDGVVLAQSYRLLNGELPHRDFISIRPCLSGLLHMVHFRSPLPLEESGRLLTLIEFFLYSFLWAFLLWAAFAFPAPSAGRVLFYFALTGITAFVVDLNTFMFYPWTTVDGILFSVLGFACLLPATGAEPKSARSFSLSVFALFFAALAALCKQNFLIVTLFTFLCIARNYRKAGQGGRLAIVALAGTSPLVLYLAMVAVIGAFPDFLRQMTGRHEYISLGIYPFLHFFFKSKLFIVNAGMMAAVSYLWLCRAKGRPVFQHTDILSKPALKLALLSMLSVYLAYTVFASFSLLYEQDYRTVPFELFWMLLTLYAASAYFHRFPPQVTLTLISGLVLSWAVSFSLGVNSPLFVSGILLTSTVYLILYLIREGRLFITDRPIRTGFHVILAAAVIALFFFALRNQKKFNYRDLPSSELTDTLGVLMPGFGEIHTNPVTYDYYRDFLNIYRRFEDKGIRNHFVLLPNNAIIYPIMRSRNPFPLDWVYRDEYLGSEKQMAFMMNRALDGGRIYVILDRYDVELLAERLVPQTYPLHKYFYIPELLKRCQKLPVESKYFDVYLSK